MGLLKYFDKINMARAAEAGAVPGPLGTFDFAGGAGSRLTRAVTRLFLRRVLPMLAAVLRVVWAIPRIGRFVLVTRYDDCVAVLSDSAAFPVVYQPEMRDLAEGVDNLLSVDGADHIAHRAILLENLRPSDIDDVEEWTRGYCTALMRAGAGRIDTMRDLISRSAVESACRLFGLTAHDPDAFGEWSMAVSRLLFGDPTGDSRVRPQAMIASKLLGSVIDDAIDRVRRFDAGPRATPDRVRTTLIDRLVGGKRMSDGEIRALIMALCTAFVPTNTLAAGNMLEHMLDHPRMLGAAKEAARKGRRDELEAILLEAGRLNPALSPGVWRHAPNGAIIADGTRRRRMVSPGDVILVCVPSALRDRRTRSAAHASPRQHAWLMFGEGPHVCAGARLALAHIVTVFEVLLAQSGLRPAGGRHGRTIARTGPYPTRYDMVWDAPTAQRACVLSAIPVRDGTSIAALENELRAIGNPVKPAVAQRLRETNCIQFTSLSAIEREPGSDEALLLLELSGDGTRQSAIAALAGAMLDNYASVFRHCADDGKQPRDASALAALIDRHAFALHRWPFGATGLNFDGLPELTVDDIDRQSQLAEFARGEIDAFLRQDTARSLEGARAMDALLRTRRRIKQDAFWGAGDRDARRFQYDIAVPSRRHLRIAGWTPPKSRLAPIRPTLMSREGRGIRFGFLALVLAFWTSLVCWLAPPWGSGWTAWVWPTVVGAIGGLALAVLATAGGLGLLVWLLRRAEKRDWSDTRSADFSLVERIAEFEDAAGHEQNHIVAVMPMKPGPVRRITFALTMWWIQQAITHWFRPGFVVTMGTIHKACWFRIPRTRQFVFLSNYDGSWESYLEDFITRANEGQSSAWSHGVGFPPTRFLILDGAADGDRFKRWVRRQQRISAVWYSRFPHLTAHQIRRNALIHDGLARAASETDARRWLATFGSAQAEPGDLETQEVQSIVFSGFGKQTYSTSLLIALPPDSPQLGTWLKIVAGVPADLKAAGAEDEHCDHDQLHSYARLRFGDLPVQDGALTLGLSASGLEKAGLAVGRGLDQLPAAFRMGMARRGRLFGDTDPVGWRFADAAVAGRCAVDAILTVYGRVPDDCAALSAHERLVDLHRRLIASCGGRVVHEVPCSPADHTDPTKEHFGFRDGISQPVIRGTNKAAAPVPPRDLVEPGEFLLGYRNLQGFVSPPIGIGAEHDPRSLLPVATAAETNRYPLFGNRGATPDLRDFGRNGSFLVVRQLDQDVAGFDAHLEDRATALRDDYRRLPELAGGAITKDWLAAKMIGRWPNGSPLVGNATAAGNLDRDGEPPNDFAYGIDDPQGLACPLGAHIRRTNPRDGLEPGDADEQRITNRHRLLRRGRSYRYAPPGDDGERTGLLFMALCSNIERQFEFVQRTWVGAHSFSGLTNEPDPLLGGPGTAGGGCDRYTIPTSLGPVTVRNLQRYVTFRGGGYFFLPSRSSLLYLIDRLDCVVTKSGQSKTKATSGPVRAADDCGRPAVPVTYSTPARPGPATALPHTQASFDARRAERKA
ncbi:MAG: hypothetical protein ABW194_03710 [Novosphingobium sp.]